MILKEIHKDMSRYLKEDCYCPNEIYSADGFFFQYFYEDEECELLGDAKKIDESNLIYCIVEKTKNHGHAILEETPEEKERFTQSAAEEMLSKLIFKELFKNRW